MYLSPGADALGRPAGDPQRGAARGSRGRSRAPASRRARPAGGCGRRSRCRSGSRTSCGQSSPAGGALGWRPKTTPRSSGTSVPSGRCSTPRRGRGIRCGSWGGTATWQTRQLAVNAGVGCPAGQCTASTVSWVLCRRWSTSPSAQRRGGSCGRRGRGRPTGAPCGPAPQAGAGRSARARVRRAGGQDLRRDPVDHAGGRRRCRCRPRRRTRAARRPGSRSAPDAATMPETSRRAAAPGSSAERSSRRPSTFEIRPVPRATRVSAPGRQVHEHQRALGAVALVDGRQHPLRRRGRRGEQVPDRLQVGIVRVGSRRSAATGCPRRGARRRRRRTAPRERPDRAYGHSPGCRQPGVNL